MKTFLITLVVFYLVLCAVIYASQRRLLYFPQLPVQFAGEQEITFDSNGETLRGYLLNPGQEKALLYYGGNAEQIEYNMDLFKSLSNYSVYLVAYRGYGNSTGTPTEVDLYHDALLIYDAIKSDYSGISVMGRSLGSGVATYVAANRPVEKVVLVTPYDSVENVAKGIYWMFPVRLLIKDKYLSWQRAREIQSPTLVLFADNDEVIPRANTENLLTHFSVGVAKSQTIAGVSHGSISANEQYQQTIFNFLHD